MNINKIKIKPGTILVSIDSDTYYSQSNVKYPAKASIGLEHRVYTVDKIGSDVNNFGNNFPLQINSKVVINKGFSATHAFKSDGRVYIILKPQGVMAMLN